MDKLMQVFQYNGAQVRVTELNGEPAFVAKDVCEILEIQNSRDAIGRLDPDEKGVVSIDTPGGPQEMQVITEAGLYALVLGSRKPEAREFKRWITHEVLPQIRKTGQYAVQPLSQIQILQQAVNLLAETEARTRALEENVDKLRANLAETHQQTHYLEARLKDTQQGMVDVNRPLRDQFNKAVRDLAIRTGLTFEAAYQRVYETLEAQTHIKIRLRADHAGVRPIEIMERNDLLVKGIRLAKAM